MPMNLVVATCRADSISTPWLRNPSGAHGHTMSLRDSGSASQWINHLAMEFLGLNGSWDYQWLVAAIDLQRDFFGDHDGA